MRVISGLAKGRKLRSPDGVRIRPTADRIKEALFNMISFDLSGAVFLDLFGGTGAIGIEALSRGAKYAVIADSSSAACENINFNLTHTRLIAGARVICADYASVLERLSLEDISFDFIYIDPPYHTGLAKSAAEKIKSCNLLKSTGVVIVESAVDEEAEAEFAGYCLYNERKYGATKLFFLRHI